MTRLLKYLFSSYLRDIKSGLLEKLCTHRYLRYYTDATKNDSWKGHKRCMNCGKKHE